MLRQAKLLKIGRGDFVTGNSCQLFGQLHIEERETWRAALFRGTFGCLENRQISGHVLRKLLGFAQ